jgi:MFS family permease
MKQFKLFNSIVGWTTFIIAAAVYLLTMEPTASFWDCGEFIATAFKLEVGHPPGAYLFMIMGRVFTLFAGNDVTQVAVMMNAMSALLSAFTVLFLFWTITHLGRKIAYKDGDYSIGKTIAIIGAGLVGALAFTFSDSFWFSAVEAEVYASSSLFTALVFWAILKWEDSADDKYANRWLVLIAYLMGLSIGVHLLNLLAIPAIVFVYYFKKYPVTRKGLIITGIISVIILAVVMYGIISGVIIFAALFERLFVNGFGLPYNSGVFFYLIALIGLIVWGLIYTYKKGKVLLNTMILCVAVILLGYSSVTMVVIRSNANTPLDENNPENMFSLLSYLNREQYGDRPLIYGPTFNAPVIENVEGKAVYTPLNGRYEVTNHKMEYKYDPQFMTLFPRMYSLEGDHVKAYKQWAGFEGRPVTFKNPRSGEMETINKPTFGENLKFFWKYQVVHMYWRYFMWNFSGRQNDVQGHGEITKGNWITGIDFIDKALVGPQDNLPDFLAKNKARNKYYMLPFLLGLFGIIYQYQRHKKDFSIVMLLFFFTGIAILLYLNQTPYQPRERDYAYTGSFYAFAIWIGIGVLGLFEALPKKMPAALRAITVTLAALVCVPGIMAKENWDDHDRSGRYTARDFAYNYLNSCEPNAIIFTNGDNDTFPLWYAQEVEGIRTDVRVVNLSYLGADWYVEQMEKKIYESDILPYSFTVDQIRQGKRDIIYLMEDARLKGRYVELKDALAFVASDNPDTKTIPGYGERIDFIPTKNFKLTVDSAQVLQSGIVPRNMASQIVPQMQWTINKSYITKSDLMVMDFLANNNWKRPIYFAITVSRDNYLNLDEYFQVTGLAYKIVPVKSTATQGDIGGVNSDVMFNNMVNKFRWGGINNPKVYLDENNIRMLSNFRSNFAKLAETLIMEGKNDSAKIVLDKCMEVMPKETVPYNYFIIPIAAGYYRLNETDKANKMIKDLDAVIEKELKYYFSLPQKIRASLDYEQQIGLQVMREMSRVTKSFGQEELSKELETKFNQMVTVYSGQ